MAKISIPYSFVTCVRCESRRQARRECAECGARPAVTEVDIHVQKRQRAVQSAIAARAQAQPALQLNSLALFHATGFGDLLDSLFAAARQVAKESSRSHERLADVVAEVAALEAWARGHRPLRPLVTMAAHVKGTIDAIGGVLDAILEALVADDLADAQRSEDRLQLALDAATDQVVAVGEIARRMDRVGTDPDPVGAWLREAVGPDFDAALAAGEAVVTDRIGVPAAGASALTALLASTVVSTVGDPDRYWRLVSDHRARLGALSTDVVVMAGDPAFTPRLQQVAEDLWSAARRAAVAPDPATLRAAAGEVLEAGHLLSEQPLKFHLGLVCALTTKHTFAGSQASDMSELVNIVTAKGWGVGAQLGDAAIRNAFAHRDFAIEGDGVSMSPKRRARDGAPDLIIPMDELHDAVLGLVEVAAAMDLALLLVLDDAGVELDLAALGQVLAPSLLALLGWSEVQVTSQGRRVTVHADVQEDVGVGAIGFVAQTLGSDGREIELDLRRPSTGEAALIEISIDGFEAWQRAEPGIDSEVATVRFGRSVSVNGVPLISDAQVAQFVAFRGVQVLVDLSTSASDRRTSVRLLRSLAKDAELAQVDRELGRCFRLRLERDVGVEFDPDEFANLLAMAKDRVPDMPSRLL